MKQKNSNINVPSLSQIWKVLMRNVEWNKKEELVAEQALRYLKVCCYFVCVFLSLYLEECQADFFSLIDVLL